MTTHQLICELHQKLGYKKSDRIGICRGISLRWLEAQLLGEEMKFADRIKKMVLENKTIVNSINAVKQKKGQNLNKQDKEYLDILAFFDSLVLFQHPHYYSSVFHTKHHLNQNDIEAISYFASSDNISILGGLAEVYSESVIYTQREIKEYLEGLSLVIEKTASSLKEPVGIVLSSHSHSIALSYNPGLGWKFMDINQYPTEGVFTNIFHYFFGKSQKNKPDLLAKQIVAAAGFGTPFSPFNARVLTTKNNAAVANLTDALEKFKKRKALTQVIAKRKKTNGVNLAYIAANNGDAEVLAELAKYGADLSAAINDGVVTPAFIAAHEGHAEVIFELIRSNVDLTLREDLNIERLRATASNRGADAITRKNDFITQRSVSWKKSIPISAYNIACIMGYEDIVQLIKNTNKSADRSMGTPSLTEIDVVVEKLKLRLEDKYSEIIDTFYSAIINAKKEYFFEKNGEQIKQLEDITTADVTGFFKRCSDAAEIAADEVAANEVTKNHTVITKIIDAVKAIARWGIGILNACFKTKWSTQLFAPTKTAVDEISLALEDLKSTLANTFDHLDLGKEQILTKESRGQIYQSFPFAC